MRAKDQPRRKRGLPGLDHLKALQETDVTLAIVRTKATEGQKSAEGYFKHDRVIYRQWQQPWEDSAVDQIVLPLEY
jgi:hypothetical protein